MGKFGLNKLFFIPRGRVWSSYEQSFCKRLFVVLGGNLLLLIICAFLNLFPLTSYTEFMALFNRATFYILLYSSSSVGDGFQVYELIKEKSEKAVEQ